MHVPVLFLGVIFSCTGSNSAADGGSALLVYFRVKINIPFTRLSTVVKSSFEYDVCELQCAAGAALDGAGHIAVADEDCHRVQLYRGAGGVHVRTIGTGSWGSGLGEFNRPCGIAIDGDGRMLVCDMNNGRVQVLQ